jgi:thioredoxin-disulfide reductase
MDPYELIVIGAGPAGITAAVYAARKKITLLVISMDIGGQAAWSGDVENYTGYQFITGPDLAAKFEEHMKKYDIRVKEGEPVVGLKKAGDIIIVRTAKGEYAARTVIVASGKRSRELGVPGEKEFKNKGLTYCATCDGPIFSGKDVAVIGGGNSALDAAIQMANIASKVYIINNTAKLAGEEIVREKLENNPKVEILNNSSVMQITGDRMVNGIKVSSGGRERTLPVKGVFVEIGLLPNSDFAKDLDRNELGEIKVNFCNETNVPGVFAAGDVTNVPEKQIIIAAGEGAKACLSAFKHLSQH